MDAGGSDKSTGSVRHRRLERNAKLPDRAGVKHVCDGLTEGRDSFSEGREL